MVDLEEVERVRLRRLLLQVDPSGVRDDLEAAARCECGCHPRPGGHVHPDGVCPCQFTTEEQAQRLAAAERALDAVHQSNTQTWELQAALLQQVADELGVEASETVPAAPWVITGRVDGRRFYMRERWDVYSIVIAPDDQPDLDVWASDVPGVTVQEGSIGDLVEPGGVIDYRVALPFIVGVIRVELRRRTCPHPRLPVDRFCSRCGTPLVDEVTADTRDELRAPDDTDEVDSLIATIDPATMISGARVAEVARAWNAYTRAESVLVETVAAARSGGDSWEIIAVVLDLPVTDVRDRFSEVGE